jgi:8-oxo-dGTP pyrophosphatase MutT (NUDIX family)
MTRRDPELRKGDDELGGKASTNDVRAPKRLYAAVPIDELARVLLDTGLGGVPLHASKRAVTAPKDDAHAVVTVFAREAEREGVVFSCDGEAWLADGRVAPHLLACRDDRALGLLGVKRKVSAGGLVVSEREDPRVMLLFRRHGDVTAWKTPKGGIEPGESRRGAARRETAEEAGLERVEVVDYLGRVQYFKPHRKRVMSEKTVHLYLMVSQDGEVGIAPREGERFVSCEWLTVDEAIARVTQPQVRRLIRRAGRRLGARNGDSARS